ncbi:hypothetical protein Pla110_00230 [Polystyrenella longa]|uniref:Uncharacterized protein n=1 Tax=Polystyrenella longa TaxID=2528007 RepID=A0A518CGH0_9PLAN|nr:hypothetical protein [Polystyrenella longa]QDU78322.1 hypothetical protein Pla110_00230 [Polystyrenella longa]
MSSEAQKTAQSQFVVTMDGDIHGEDNAENRDIVRRIHACWNACDGIPTDELENGIISDMRNVISTMIPVLNQAKQPASGMVKKPNIMKEAKHRADSHIEETY